MGCYGIGVTRVVAAAIEQNHDERGIIWPEPIAPFQVVLVPLNLHKSARVREVSDQLYAELGAAGIEVLYDDRDARPGVKFADAELWAFRIAWWWPSAGSRRAGSNTAAAATLRAASSPPRRRSPSCAHGSRPEPTPRPGRHCSAYAAAPPGWSLRSLLRCSALSCCSRRRSAAADQQRDPELQAVVASAIAAGPVLHRPVRLGRLVHADGAAAAHARAERRTSASTSCRQVYCETHRTGEARLPPGLVMALIVGREPLRSLGGLLAPAQWD